MEIFKNIKRNETILIKIIYLNYVLINEKNLTILCYLNIQILRLLNI
jgi:hypothetical protein